MNATPASSVEVEWIELVPPARASRVAAIAIWSALFACYAWAYWLVVQDTKAEHTPAESAALLFGMTVVGLLLFFPITRNVHALVSTPYFRVNENGLEVRHWGGDWNWPLPVCLYGVDRVRWDEIEFLEDAIDTYNGVPVRRRLAIHCGRKDPVVVDRVFAVNTTELRMAMHHYQTAVELRDRLSPTARSAFVENLKRRFLVPVSLKYRRRRKRLLGLIVGAAATFGSGAWLWHNAGDNTGLDLLLAVVFATCLLWTVFGIDEAVRMFRLRRRSVWLRSTGIAVGDSEWSAQERSWNEVLYAELRQPDVHGLALGNCGSNGMDVAFRSGRYVHVPEGFSNDLDLLAVDLTPQYDARTPETTAERSGE